MDGLSDRGTGKRIYRCFLPDLAGFETLALARAQTTHSNFLQTPYSFGQNFSNEYLDFHFPIFL